MESPDIIRQKDSTSSVTIVVENSGVDDKISVEVPHDGKAHEKTVIEEIAQRRDVHENYVLSTSETGNSSCKGLDVSSSKGEDYKSCIRKEEKDSTNFQTLEAYSSQVSFRERFHGGKQPENSCVKGIEKCKEQCAEEEKVLEMSRVDEINGSKETTPGEINVRHDEESDDLKHHQDADGLKKWEQTTATEIKGNDSVVITKVESNEIRNSRNVKETLSAFLKERSQKEKGVERGSFQEDATGNEERTRFSTRIKKNAAIPLPEGFGVFRQCPKDAKFLSCISSSEFCLPPEIRLYRHRSIVSPLPSSNTARITKRSKTENSKSVDREVASSKRHLLSPSYVKPSKNIGTRGKPTMIQPARNAKSIRRAKEILIKRKTNVSAVRRSLRQKLGALNVKKNLKMGMRGSYSTRQHTSQSLRSNVKEGLIEKETPDTEIECRGRTENVKKRKEENEISKKDGHKYKHLSAAALARLQKMWEIRRQSGGRRKSKFTQKKDGYRSIRGEHQREGYVRRFKFRGQSDNKKRVDGEQNVPTNFRKISKRNSRPISNKLSHKMEHFQTSLMATSQMFSEQRRKPNKFNFNGKQSLVIPQFRENFLVRDPDFIPDPSDTSDPEIHEDSVSVSTNHSRVGSPEIEIDIDLSQDSEAVPQDEVISEAPKSRDCPTLHPMENENAPHPRKLPIFRKLPNPSSDPVAVFYYNPEATMLRRCSKYHSCCQQSAAAAAVTKADSSTQWEDPTVLYDIIRSRALLGFQQQHSENSSTLPAYALVQKKHGKYKIKGQSDINLPHFSAILTASQDREETKKGKDSSKKPLRRKSVKSKSHSKVKGSSKCASTVMPTSEIVSSHMATSASNSNSLTAGISVLNNAGLPVRSISILKDTDVSPAARPTSTASALRNSTPTNAAAVGSAQPVAVPGIQISQPLATPGVQKYGSLPLVDEAVDRSHFLFKDGILWQKVLRDDVFVWAKVDDNLYNIVNGAHKPSVELKHHMN